MEVDVADRIRGRKRVDQVIFTEQDVECSVAVKVMGRVVYQTLLTYAQEVGRDRSTGGLDEVAIGYQSDVVNATVSVDRSFN